MIFPFLAAAVLTSTPGPLEKKNVKIAVGGKTLFYYLPLTLAEQLGYFKDEGLEVQISDFAGGAKALQAMMGGSADVVSGSYEHTVTMAARGSPVVGIVLQTRLPSIALALRKQKATSYKSPKDLKGMKIGVTAPGSSTNFFVNAVLAKDGLKPDDVSIIGVGASGSAVAGIERGELDGLSNLDPVITKLERDGAVQIVADTRTEEGMKKWYGPDYAAACIYATPDFLAKNPNTAQAIVNAMVRALYFVKSTPADKILKTVPAEYYAGDRDTYVAALQKVMPGFSADGKFTQQAAETVYQVLKLFEPSVMNAKVDLSKTYDNRFAEKAPRK
jgi:NitT/TauT family transport system substrate-binding protein